MKLPILVLQHMHLKESALRHSHPSTDQLHQAIGDFVCKLKMRIKELRIMKICENLFPVAGIESFSGG